MEASILRAKDLLPNGLKCPKADGPPPPGSWPNCHTARGTLPHVPVPNLVLDPG